MAPNSTVAGMARHPLAAQENPALSVAAACAKDSAFRILAAIDNSTGWVQYETNAVDPTVNGGSTGNWGGHAGTLYLRPSEFKDMLTAGRTFTILGCSFGNLPGRGMGGPPAGGAGSSRATPTAHASGGTRVYMVQQTYYNYNVDFTIKSWNDNSITIAAPPGTSPENVAPYAVVVQRIDGSFIAYNFLVSNKR